MMRPPAPYLLLAFVGMLAIVAAFVARRRRGLNGGSTVALDDTTLFSKRHRLVGRPDRIVKRGNAMIPEEWKSGRRLEPWHEYQLGTYFILIEEHYGIRPPYGLLVLGNGRRHRIENTDELRNAVLLVADRIREARYRADEELPGVAQESRCRACGQRSICRQQHVRISRRANAGG